MRKQPTYKDYEKQFPDYVIIRKLGCFYEAYGKSAEIVSLSWNTNCMKTTMAS